MRIKNANLLLTLFSVVILATLLSATLVKSESTVFIKGTSNLHDWEMEVEKFNCDMQLTKEGQEVKSIDKLVFTCKTADIKSGNSIMDKKTLKALKSDKHKTIKFKMIKMKKFEKNGTKINGQVYGTLTLAGKAKNIYVNFKGTMTSKKLKVQTTKSLKMSDFGIDPPTALMGTLTTGDKVNIIAKLSYNI